MNSSNAFEINVIRNTTCFCIRILKLFDQIGKLDYIRNFLDIDDVL